jgi:hypothetical protein
MIVVLNRNSPYKAMEGGVQWLIRKLQSNNSALILWLERVTLPFSCFDLGNQEERILYSGSVSTVLQFTIIYSVVNTVGPRH